MGSQQDVCIPKQEAGREEDLLQEERKNAFNYNRISRNHNRVLQANGSGSLKRTDIYIMFDHF